MIKYYVIPHEVWREHPYSTEKKKIEKKDIPVRK